MSAPSASDPEERVRADLDWPYVQGVAADVAMALSDGGAVEALFQPGDGTRYSLVFVPLWTISTARPRRAPIRGGSGTEVDWGSRACAGMGNEDGYIPGDCLVAWVEHAVYPLRLGPERGFLHWSYVAEHWRTSQDSAIALVLLFRAISEAWT